MGLIDIDYRDTLRKADQLERLASELRGISTRELQNLRSGVGRSWWGSSAEMYKKRSVTLSRQIESQARDMQRMANSLRQSAERYRRLEILSKTIFGG